MLGEFAVPFINLNAFTLGNAANMYFLKSAALQLLGSLTSPSSIGP